MTEKQRRVLLAYLRTATDTQVVSFALATRQEQVAILRAYAATQVQVKLDAAQAMRALIAEAESNAASLEAEAADYQEVAA